MIKLVNDLLEGKDYALGEPWQRKESLGILVPILGINPPKQRGYCLLEEVKDKVEMTDSGGIGNVILKNNSGQVVFIRSGTIFAGQGTQSRAVEASSMVQPTKSKQGVEIPVRCIHASHGIHTGAAFSLLENDAPAAVHYNLLKGDQGAVWGSVHTFSESIRSRLQESSIKPSHRVTPREDDLVGVITAAKETEAYKDVIDQVIREMPSVETQVGVVILDSEGVVGLETFDSPESWRAISNAVIAKYGDLFTETPKSPFKIEADKDRVFQLIKDFLNLILQAKEKVINPHTFLLEETVIGEYSILNKHIIHLIAFRRRLKGTEGTREPTPARFREELTFDQIHIHQPQHTPAPTTTMASIGPHWEDPREWQPTNPKKRKLLLRIDEMQDDFLSKYALSQNIDKTSAINGLIRDGLTAKGFYPKKHSSTKTK